MRGTRWPWLLAAALLLASGAAAAWSAPGAAEWAVAAMLLVALAWLMPVLALRWSIPVKVLLSLPAVANLVLALVAVLTVILTVVAERRQSDVVTQARPATVS